WGHFTAEDHQTWRTLFQRQSAILQGQACDEYFAGLKTLGITADGVPDFEKMNKNLRKATGWEVVAVQGLIPSRPFFTQLSSLLKRPVPWCNTTPKAEMVGLSRGANHFSRLFRPRPPAHHPRLCRLHERLRQGGRRRLGQQGRQVPRPAELVHDRVRPHQGPF